MQAAMGGLMLAAALAGEPGLRDADGQLQLADCAAARAWLATAPAPAAGDAGVVLDAALGCARAQESAAARALQALADAAPEAAPVDAVGDDIRRVRIHLALGEVAAAGERLRASTARTLQALRERSDDPMYGVHAYWQSVLNNDLAARLRESQPTLAIEHQLLAADCHELAGESGSLEFAALYHVVAIDIALEASLPAQSADASRRLLALHARHPDVERMRAADSIGASVGLLDAAGRADDASALLRELEATGWPEAGPVVELLQRRSARR